MAHQPGLAQLPWYDALEWRGAGADEGDCRRGNEHEQLCLSTHDDGIVVPTLGYICAEVLRQHILQEARRENVSPATRILGFPLQMPYLEPAVQAAFQVVVWQSRSLSAEELEQLPPEVQDVLQLLKGLREAAGVSTFLGPGGVVQAREILACAQEGLRERHERLCKAMSDVVLRLIIDCMRSTNTGHLRDLQDSVVWECAQGIAVHKIIQLLRSPSWEAVSRNGSLSDKLGFIVRQLFCMNSRREAQLAAAQHNLELLLPLEEKLRKAMSVVRSLWLATTNAGSSAHRAPDPMQDTAFLAGLHGKSWHANHADAFVNSFQASGEELLVGVLKSAQLTSCDTV